MRGEGPFCWVCETLVCSRLGSTLGDPHLWGLIDVCKCFEEGFWGEGRPNDPLCWNLGPKMSELLRQVFLRFLFIFLLWRKDSSWGLAKNRRLWKFHTVLTS